MIKSTNVNSIDKKDSIYSGLELFLANLLYPLFQANHFELPLSLEQLLCV